MSDVGESDEKRHQLNRKEAALFCITDLPNVLLKECLYFVGPGHYHFIAGICRRFQEIYSFPQTTT